MRLIDGDGLKRHVNFTLDRLILDKTVYSAVLNNVYEAIDIMPTYVPGSDAKVMTLNEIEQAARDEQVVYLEWNDRVRPVFPKVKTPDSFMFIANRPAELHLPLKEFNDNWRCWDKNPTQVLRDVTKWDP